MSKPSLLIICYSFPPFPGIGGRRWAKFAKYFQLSGFDVNVIASENPFNKISEWSQDTENVTVIPLALKYPKSLILFPKTIYGRVRYQIDLCYVKLFTKGNYYDRTVFWRKQLLKTAGKLITQKNITNVIVTGAPFSLFSHISHLKKKFPTINLLADIRDPWTNNETAYSFNNLSLKRLSYEKSIEKSVFNYYDKVVSVNQQITNYFQGLYPHIVDKFVTVMNGFDPQEINLESVESVIIDETKLNFVFSGSFYEKAFYLFDNLISTVEQLKRQGDEQKTHFYFYGPNAYVLEKKLINSGVRGNFTFGNFNKITEVNWLVNKSDYALLFLTDDIDYSFSTKFCEYIKLEKKIVVFSKSGLTAKYVEENQIGFHVKPNDELRVFDDLIRNNSNKIFPPEFDRSKFSIEKLTKDFTNLFF